MDAYLEMLPSSIVSFFENTSWIWALTQTEKYRELQGIVEAIDSSKMDISKAVLLNALYELEAWCTSIIAKSSDGSILHQRNLDFDNPNQMRKITYTVTFKRDEDYVYDAVMFAGNVGVYTAIKKGAFSVSENERFPETDKKGALENMMMLFQGTQEISWLIRSTFETCDDYECAYQKLGHEKICALGYIILAGVKDEEGVVVSRSRYGIAHEEHLNATQWFLVQTNNDHWTPGGCYNRCESATTNLELLGQDALTQDSLRDSVLLQFPNLNYETLYNTQLTPSSGAIDTIPTKYAGNDWEYHAPSVKSDRPGSIRDLGDVTYFDLFKAAVNSMYY